MHTAATWLELASRARLVADSMSDPSERTAMLDIAADYEQQAQGTPSHPETALYLGAYQSRIW